MPKDQLLLKLKEVEQIEAAGQAEEEKASPQARGERFAKRRMNRRSLPAHLQRIYGNRH